VLTHASALVCPPPRHRLSGHFPHTLSLLFNTIPTILTAFPPRLAALPKPCSDPRCRSNPIAHRVRRKHQRLPPSLLIENASDRYPAPPQKSAPSRFRSRLATTRKSGPGLNLPCRLNSRQSGANHCSSWNQLMLEPSGLPIVASFPRFPGQAAQAWSSLAGGRRIVRPRF
jgi:hypothetical protein